MKQPWRSARVLRKQKELLLREGQNGRGGGVAADDDANSQHRSLIDALKDSCSFLEYIIRKRFSADVPICYPKRIREDERQNPSSFPLLHFSGQNSDEFLQHLLRLVRPSSTEHERRLPSSRQVKHNTASKLLVPVVFDPKTAMVLAVGYPHCFPLSRPRGGDDDTSYRTVEIVIDFNPPPGLIPLNRISYLRKKWQNVDDQHRVARNKRRASQDFSNVPVEDDNNSSNQAGDQKQQNIKAAMYHSLSTPALHKEEDPPNNNQTSPTHDVEVDERKDITHHHTTEVAIGLLKVQGGYYAAKGRRQKMEDRTVATTDLLSTLHNRLESPKLSFFAIYDGHGGADSADFVARNLHREFVKASAFAEGDYGSALLYAFTTVETSLASLLRQKCYYETQIRAKAPWAANNIKCYCACQEDKGQGGFVSQLSSTVSESEARADAGVEIPPVRSGISPLPHICTHCVTANFATVEPPSYLEEEVQRLSIAVSGLPNDEDEIDQMDESYINDSQIYTSGTTAIVTVIVGTDLYVANLGDSRCILCRDRLVACLTEDHRLRSNSRENNRVQSVPGTYSWDGYLCGQLGVSRAFGNVNYKTGSKLLGLSSVPDIIQLSLTPEDEFLVVGCDGLFDVVTAIDAAVIVQQVLRSGRGPKAAAQELAELALISHAEDNISVIVIDLVWSAKSRQQPGIYTGSYSVKADRLVPEVNLTDAPDSKKKIDNHNLHPVASAPDMTNNNIVHLKNNTHFHHVS